MKKIYPRNAIMVGIATALLITAFCALHAVSQTKPPTKCERCIKLEYAILQVLATIENDQTDYVLDVLCETDEYCNLYELLNEDCIIRDSTYHKLRTVFPDLPAKQAPQWK